MELHHDFEIPAGVDRAWALLLDIPRIAPCMPGAELTEIAGDDTYKGNARVKVGPVQLRFAGEARVSDIDEAARTARVAARGSDAKGRGNASADVRFALSPAGAGRTRVDVLTDLSLTGTVAQYGRASGLIDEIARQIIADFVRNLEAELGADGARPAGEAPVPSEAASSRAGADAAPSGPAPGRAPASGQAVSGLSLLLRAIGAMIRRWLGLSAR